MGESERERKVREIVTGENLERTRERESARERKREREKVFIFTAVFSEFIL